MRTLGNEASIDEKPTADSFCRGLFWLFMKEGEAKPCIQKGMETSAVSMPFYIGESEAPLPVTYLFKKAAVCLLHTAALELVSGLEPLTC